MKLNSDAFFANAMSQETRIPTINAFMDTFGRLPGGKCFLLGITNEDDFIQDKISTGCLTNMEVLSKRRGLPNDSSVK